MARVSTQKLKPPEKPTPSSFVQFMKKSAKYGTYAAIGVLVVTFISINSPGTLLALITALKTASSSIWEKGISEGIDDILDRSGVWKMFYKSIGIENTLNFREMIIKGIEKMLPKLLKIQTSKLFDKDILMEPVIQSPTIDIPDSEYPAVVILPDTYSPLLMTSDSDILMTPDSNTSMNFAPPKRLLTPPIREPKRFKKTPVSPIAQPGGEGKFRKVIPEK